MKTIFELVQQHEQAWLADLAALCAIDCGTENKAGVDAVGQLVMQRCAGWGWEIQHYPQKNWGDCHTATLHGKGDGRLMLMGHLDTVYFDGTVAAHPARRDGNRLYQPGAGDMKGGLLTGMYAMRALQLSGFDAFESLTFFFNSEEEHGSPVSKVITAALAPTMDAGLVFEPARANGAIVSARKAAATFTAKISGFSTHAGIAPEKGINAVLAAARLIEAAAALNGCAPGVTVTPSVIHGGTASNVVPDECVVKIDTRAADPAGMKTVEAGMAALADRDYVRGAEVEITGGFGFPPMTKTLAVAMMCEHAKAVATTLGFELQDVATGGGSDASVIAPFAPVIDGLGPVSGNAHNASEEYIELDSVVPRTAMAALLIKRMLAPEALAELRKHKPG